MEKRDEVALTYKDLSDNRNALFGFAILSVCVFHLYFLLANTASGTNFIANMLFFILETGNIGVDIFVFLSGFGLFHSLYKKSGLRSFYIKRAVRILPAYWTGLILFFALNAVLNHAFDIKDFVMHFTLVDYFVTGDAMLWYVPFTVVLYLLYPLLYRYADTVKKKTVLFFILLLISFATHFIPGFEATEYDVAKDRLPLFVLGTITAQMSLENRENKIIPVRKKALPAVFIIFLVLVDLLLLYLQFIHEEPYDLMFFIYLPLSLLLIVIVLYCIKNVRADYIKKFLTVTGGMSFELYLSNTLTMELIASSSEARHFGRILIAGVFCTGTLAGAMLLNLVSVKISGIISKKHLA